MDIATQAEPLPTPAAEAMQRQSHEDRRQRRKEMADLLRHLFETKPEAATCSLMAEVANRFQVCLGTVIMARKEYGVTRNKKESMTRQKRSKSFSERQKRT